MKYRVPLCTVLIAAGLVILSWQSILHLRAATGGTLKPYDEEGEPVAMPFVGTMCLGGGIFLLVLTSRRK